MGEFSDEFVGESIRSRRERGTLRRNYGADAALEARQNRAQEATESPVENEQSPWEVQAMEFFRDRLDEIHESMVREFSGIMIEQSRLHTRIDALVALVNESLDERSESRVAVEPTVTIVLDGVPADISAELQSELQSELQTRVERIMARRTAGPVE